MEDDLKYASFKDRVIAIIFDIVILTAISFTTKGIIIELAKSMNLAVDVGALDYLGRILLGPVYFIVMLYFFQASLGNMIMKIKVVSESGDRMLFIQSLLREVVGKPVCILTLGYGYFWIIADKRNQGFHDKIAKTVVIYDK